MNNCNKVFEVPTSLTRIPVKTSDIFIEPGYEICPVMIGLTFPTTITFDEQGQLYVGEAGYSYGPGFSNGLGRILKLTRSGVEEVARNFRPPLTGLVWRDGYFYIAEGGYPGRILRVSPDGRSRDVLVDNLPTAGDHYTGDIVFGPDGKMYFGVGTATNSGVVGLDNMPWLMVLPQFHDFSCRNIILNGINFESVNIFKPYEPQPTLTGAFKPFGSPSRFGEAVACQLRCNGVIYRANPDGSDLHIFADGFRNPYALGFSPDNRLLTIDQGYDYRGSRPVANSPETMWHVTDGGWYGWPDYVAGVPITDPYFSPPGKEPLSFLIAEHPPIPSELHIFPHGETAMKFDFSRGQDFGFAGEIFVALFGEAAPDIFAEDVEIVEEYERRLQGFKVIRVNPVTHETKDFIANKVPGPRGTGIERPVDVKFSPDGKTLYVLDFGIIQSNNAGWMPWANSGILWAVHPT